MGEPVVLVFAALPVKLLPALAEIENCAQMLPLLVQLVHQQRLAATALVIAA